MKTYTIRLDDDIAHRLEIRAAIDDLPAETGIELLLTEIIIKYEEAKK